MLESTKDDIKAPQGVVWKAMWRTHYRVFLQAGAVKLIHDCILFIGDYLPDQSARQKMTCSGPSCSGPVHTVEMGGKTFCRAKQGAELLTHYCMFLVHEMPAGQVQHCFPVSASSTQRSQI